MVRVAFVASLAVTGGLACWVYLAFWALTPYSPSSRAPAQRFMQSLHSFFTTSVASSGPVAAASPNEGPDSGSNVARVD